MKKIFVFEIFCRKELPIAIACFLNIIKIRLNRRYSHQNTALKMSKYGDFSGPFFPVFKLNAEIYSVNRFTP